MFQVLRTWSHSLDCPNRKPITLTEWEVITEDEIEEEKKENSMEDEEENQKE